MLEGVLPYLPHDRIEEALRGSPGNEIDSGKLANPESSAALAVNTFGLFLDQPERLPLIPGIDRAGWPATRVTIEECAAFPWWPRGRHPWLDAFVETETHIIGIESKRYEPYRSKAAGSFSDAYWRDVWGERMGAFERLRDDVQNGKLTFERLDAVQLVKHAFGLRTEGERRGKPAMLVYLYAEPEAWPDGRRVDEDAIRQHRSEIATFAQRAVGDEVTFTPCSYKALLDTCAVRGDPVVRDHAAAVRRHFRLQNV